MFVRTGVCTTCVCFHGFVALSLSLCVCVCVCACACACACVCLCASSSDFYQDLLCIEQRILSSPLQTLVTGCENEMGAFSVCVCFLLSCYSFAIMLGLTDK